MSDETLIKLLEAQQAHHEQMQQLMQLFFLRLDAPATNATNSVTSTEAPASTNKTVVFKNVHIEKFNPDTCRAEDYIEFFEEKCRIHDIQDDNTKKDLLITNLTPEIFHEVKTALTPNFKTTSYENVREKLLDLYRVKRTRYRALTDFWGCVREHDETMEHYANRLKKISRDCGYDNTLLERQLRDRFATGLNHPDLETDLKQMWPDLRDTHEGKTSEVTFAQIFAVAQSREQAEHDTAGPSINKIKRKLPPRTTTNERQHGSPRKLRADKCLRCGQNRHELAKCPAKYHTCAECETDGHFESCCIKSGRAYIAPAKTRRESPKRRVKKLTKQRHQSSKDTDDSTYTSYNSDDDDELPVYNLPSTKDCKKIDCTIEGIHCTMDWDPGSPYSISNTKLWKRIGSPPLTKAPKLKAYGNTRLKTKGIAHVTVQLEQQQKILPVVVMNHADPMLFGLRWSEMFDMDFPSPVYSIKHKSPTTLKQVLDNYQHLFDNKLGKVKNYYVNIHVKPGGRNQYTCQPDRLSLA
ncbi:hypothetical protein NE865_10873 [Phthorimaea operculella]|nr:hypothetical protein NE865_10873 [Phthorimaea operculella]